MNHRFSRYLLSLHVIATILLPGCAGEDESPPPWPASSPGFDAQGSNIQLIDLLPNALVRSPLQETEGDDLIPAGGDAVVLETPVDLTFQGESPPNPWGPTCASRQDPVKGAFLRCALDGSPPRRSLSIRSSQEGTLSVKTRLRAQPEGCARIVVNGLRDLPIHVDLKTVGESWTDVNRRLHTPNEEKSIEIAFSRRESAENCQLDIQSIKIEQRTVLSLLDSDGVVLAYLKKRWTRPGSDPNLGVAKSGILLPVNFKDVRSAPFDDNFTDMEALFAPPPTDIHFWVRIPPRASLRFWYALSNGSRAGDEAELEILIRTENAPYTSLWTGKARAIEEEWYWKKARVSLEAYAGRNVELLFRSRSAPGRRAYVLWGIPTISSARRAGDPPNIILLSVDTLRADRLGIYGHPDDLTPNIDALGRDGVVFEHASSQSNWTRAAFASLLSGVGVSGHGVNSMSPNNRIPHAMPNLPKILRAAGWTTHALMYKMALYDSLGLPEGFEAYFNGPIRNVQGSSNLSKALDWLDDNDDRRFFLWLHFNDPHQPFTHPPEYRSVHSQKILGELDIDFPLSVSTYSKEQPSLFTLCDHCGSLHEPSKTAYELARALYNEEVHYVDSLVGRFLDDLKRRGLYDDAIIVFHADHGEMLWDYDDYYSHGGNHAQEPLVHIPLMIKPAGKGFAVGKRVSQHVRLYDAMPTILELAGIDPGAYPLEARSLVPFLASSNDDALEERDNLCQGAPFSSFRHGPWKYVRYIPPGTRPSELYSLKGTPPDEKDVRALHPQVYRDLFFRELDYALRHYEGRYLVVPAGEQASEKPTRVTIAWEGPVGWYPTNNVGLRMIHFDPPGTYVFEGKESDPIALFIRFTAGDEGVTVQVERPDQEPEIFTFHSGDFEQMHGDLRSSLNQIDSHRVLVFAASGFPGQAVQPHAKETSEGLSAEQREALKALGYLQ